MKNEIVAHNDLKVRIEENFFKFNKKDKKIIGPRINLTFRNIINKTNL